VRRLGLLPCVVMLGCRGLLGIEDPTVIGDGGGLCTGDDYDRDGTPDACDPCPMYSEVAADADTDGDSIGDGCDPNPQVKGDKRMLWTDFARGTDIEAWSVQGGTWSIGDGGLLQAEAAATARIALPDTYSNVHLATEVNIVAHGSNAYAGACGYIDTNTFKCCDVRRDGNVIELMAWSHFGMSVIDWAGGFQPGTIYELATTASTAKLACAAHHNSVHADATLMNTGSTGKIALHTREVSAEYRYLFVVQMP
jgi:hypothetical protein